MPWLATISTLDVVAIHAALICPGMRDGEILFFGGDDHNITNANSHDYDHTKTFNCKSPSEPLTYVSSPGWDTFCCGHAMLGDGGLLIAGGTDTFPHNHTGIHTLHFTGLRKCAQWSPLYRSIQPVADMNFEPGAGARGGGRWYPTLCTLGTGEVLAFGGHPAVDDSRHSNTTPERFSQLSNAWTNLPGPIGVEPPDPVVYPRMHVLNDGDVFVSSNVPNYTMNIKFNPWTGFVNPIVVRPDIGYWGFDFPSVLLPLMPTDGYRCRILLCGQNPSQLYDFGQQHLNWQTVPRDAPGSSATRVHSSATLLPTGQVVLTGGATRENDQISNGNNPEIYHTPIDLVNKAYLPDNVGRWETLQDPATVTRNYHSTALLMPDGRVWTAGGNGPNQPGGPPGAEQKLIEIWQPPYPPGPRPVITSCPDQIYWGQPFQIGVPTANDVGNVVLMRCGSSTHAFNPDQRCIFLLFTKTFTTVKATAPPNSNIAPPGNYMVFVINSSGRPCEYASFVLMSKEG
jgi:Domain of unknown function (DUF1929)